MFDWIQFPYVYKRQHRGTNHGQRHEDEKYQRVLPSSIPNSLLMKFIRSSFRGFVKISANWFVVSINSNTTSPFCTWSLRKWCLMSMCLLLECWIGFLERFIALVLSHLMGMQLITRPKSFNYCFIHKTCDPQHPAATYSASAVDKATLTCFLEHQKTKKLPSSWQVLEVLFLSIKLPA